MLKLIAATVVGIWAVLLVFGDETRRADPSQTERGSVFEFSFASFIPQSSDIDAVALAPVSALSDVDAVKIAVKAGELLRAGRDKAFGGDIVAAASGDAETVPGGDADLTGSETTDRWYVSAARVNLRAGPGTGNAVVAQVTLGTKAEVLSDPAANWIEIRTADGTAGWISANFLTETAPG